MQLPLEQYEILDILATRINNRQTKWFEIIRDLNTTDRSKLSTFKCNLCDFVLESLPLSGYLKMQPHGFNHLKELGLLEWI